MVKAKLALVALATASSLASCHPPDGCIPRATRCLGAHSQICDADRSWHDLADCDRVGAQSGAPFACRYVDVDEGDGHVAGYACVPARTRDGGASR